MAKVYIVTSGSHSAYTIEKVFSTEELANIFLEEANKGKDKCDYDNYQVEEFEVDPETTERSWCVITITMNLNTGDCVYAHPDYYFQANKPDYNDTRINVIVIREPFLPLSKGVGRIR